MTLPDDEAKLAKMGYKQELKRELTLLQNFGMGFSVVSIITGISSLFPYGMATGGPAVMVWSWPVACFFTMMVGLALAELCSSHPTSGGPYYWAAKLTSPKRAPLASWITGWFSLLGQIAMTTGLSFACANFISTTAVLGGTGYEPGRKSITGIHAAVLISQGLINTVGVHLLGLINTVSVWVHVLGTTTIIVAILAKAPTHQSAKFVFTTFYDGTGTTPDDGSPAIGWSERISPAYVAVIGILMAQYTITGFDASAYMAEETRDAARSGSYGIILAIGGSSILGWCLILGLLFSIQDWENTLHSPTGQPVAQIILDTTGSRSGAIMLMVIAVVAMYACGTFSVTSNSRMMYAFARDGALPGHKFWEKVPKSQTPVRTVWLSVALSFALGLASLGSSVAFAAATSIATIGLYSSYGIPIVLRLLNPNFKKGPFHLGAFSYPVFILATMYITFLCVVLILPQVNPITSQTFNYTIVATGLIVVYSVGFWLISARKWFTGPIRHINGLEIGIEVSEPLEPEKIEDKA